MLLLLLTITQIQYKLNLLKNFYTECHFMYFGASFLLPLHASYIQIHVNYN